MHALLTKVLFLNASIKVKTATTMLKCTILMFTLVLTLPPFFQVSHAPLSRQLGVRHPRRPSVRQAVRRHTPEMS